MLTVYALLHHPSRRRRLIGALPTPELMKLKREGLIYLEVYYV